MWHPRLQILHRHTIYLLLCACHVNAFKVVIVCGVCVSCSFFALSQCSFSFFLVPLLLSLQCGSVYITSALKRSCRNQMIHGSQSGNAMKMRKKEETKNVKYGWLRVCCRALHEICLRHSASMYRCWCCFFCSSLTHAVADSVCVSWVILFSLVFFSLCLSIKCKHVVRILRLHGQSLTVFSLHSIISVVHTDN